MGANIDFIVPNRFEYGYGLTPEIVELTAREKQPDIIITVDNGIASIDGVAEANRRGIEVVVTDHHLPADTLPAARVIVNPNQPECGFPSKHMAGVGVMFYVLLALRAELRKRGVFDAQTQPKLDALLDLVALGTVADVVRLDANNRILVAQGLKRMRAGRMHAGVAALFRVAGAIRATPIRLTWALRWAAPERGRPAGRHVARDRMPDHRRRRPRLAAGAAAQRHQPETPRNRSRHAGHGHAAPGRLRAGRTQHHLRVRRFVASGRDRHRGLAPEKFYRPTITFAPGADGWIKGRAVRSPASTCATRWTWCTKKRRR
jgi:single-stranded-DNA-specific exonuclease